MRTSLQVRLELETPEQVVLSLPLAGIGSRIAAYGVDLLIRLALSLLMVIPAIFVAVNFPGLEGYAFVAMLAACFALHFGYYVYFEVLYHGRTPGKRRLGLRTVKLNGAPVDFLSSVLRNLLRLVDWLPGFYGIGVAVMFLSSSEQRLGDITAGTVVVQERPEPVAGLEAWLDRPAFEHLCQQLHIADPERIEPNLTREEVDLLVRFLGRLPLLYPSKTTELADRIAARLREKVTDPDGVLEPYYTQPASRAAALEFLLRRQLLDEQLRTGGPAAT